MVKDNTIYLAHILVAIENIDAYMTGLDESAFMENQMLKDAVVKNIENIGEAAKSVSEDFQKEHKNVPWRDMSDMRNLLVHEYFGIDYKEVYSTLENDLPELRSAIEDILK